MPRALHMLASTCLPCVRPGAQVRPPMPPAFFFVIDVSHAAVASGVLSHVCRAIRASLDRLPGGERTRIGFLTFDTALHFYNLKAGLTQPQMMARAPGAPLIAMF